MRNIKLALLCCLLSNTLLTAQDYFWLGGSEPGWDVEIEKGKWIVLNTNYGEDTVTFPCTDPVSTDNFWFYRSAIKGKNYDPEIHIIIFKEKCTDDADQVMDYRARVIWSHKVLDGCGRLERKVRKKHSEEEPKRAEADKLKNQIGDLYKKKKNN